MLNFLTRIVFLLSTNTEINTTQSVATGAFTIPVSHSDRPLLSI